MRTLNKIAADILVSWRNKAPSDNTRRFAYPYVEAMLGIQKCSDMYGMEYGDMVVAYALNNLAQWRGDDARRIKAELREHLEKHNADHQSSQRQ